VEVRLSVFRSDSSSAALSKTERIQVLQPHQPVVTSSAQVASLLPLGQFDGGYLVAETIGRGPIAGAKVIEESISGQRNLVVLNGLGMPSSCMLDRAGSC
jgi:hypothetical protein